MYFMEEFDVNMNCDICKIDQKAILVLRKKRFTLKGKRLKKVHRVCFFCAKKLVSHEEYDFGVYWKMIFHFWSVRK